MNTVLNRFPGIALLCLIFGLTVNCLAQISALYEPARPPFVELTKSGNPNAQIVVPLESTPLEDLAASEFQKYLRLMSGVELPIVKEGKNSNEVFLIFLGNTDKAARVGASLNDLNSGSDGFEIRTFPEGMIIHGRNDLGTVFGVYELLERYFDIRWFMPDEEYYPKNLSPKIGQINLVFKPSFAYREVSRGEWSLKQRMNVVSRGEYGSRGRANTGSLALGRNVGINMKWDAHTFSRLIPKEKYFADHPEYFALIDGRRQVTDARPVNTYSPNNQLCTSNPGLVQEVAKNLIDTLDANPDIDVITLNPNDGGGFCQCEECRSLDESGRDSISTLSKRIFTFSNQVAEIVKKRHPKVLVKILAYVRYTRPPLDPNFRLADNIIVQLCHIKFCHSHPLGSDQCKPGETYKPTGANFPNSEFEKILREWARLTPRVFIYEYYTLGGMEMARLPWPLIHCIRTDIPFYRENGVVGFYTQTNAPWYRNGLNYYVAAKLAWNANINVDALLNDYFDKCYGPAASPVREHYMTMEKAMQDWNGCISYGLQGVDIRGVAGIGVKMTGPKIYTPEVMKHLEESLLRAEGLTSKDETLSRRVGMIRKMYGETKDALKAIAGTD